MSIYTAAGGLSNEAKRLGQLRLLLPAERGMIRGLRAADRNFYEAVINDPDGIQSYPLADEYRRAQKIGYRRAVADVRSVWQLSESEHDKAMNAYLAGVGALFIQEAAEAVKEKVKAVIAESVTIGRRERVTAGIIRDITGGSIGYSRAKKIARTETHRAAVRASQIIAVEDFGLKRKQWISAVHQERTRSEHRRAYKQTVAMNEKFTVGGEKLDRPGDPAASAKIPSIAVVC